MASNFLLIRRLNRNFSQILAKPKPESIDSLHDEIARDLSMEFFLTIKKEFEGFRTLFFDNLVRFWFGKVNHIDSKLEWNLKLLEKGLLSNLSLYFHRTKYQIM